MNLIILRFMLLVSSAPLVMLQLEFFHSRVMYGITDTSGRYPYVIALVATHARGCSGTLISSEWVLTARHCLQTCMTHIQYGDMSLAPNMSEEKSLIIKMVPQPGFRSAITSTVGLRNDIGLCRVKPILLKTYGKLSSIDYKLLLGLPVVYAGYHETKYPYIEDQPVQIAHGVISSCEKSETSGPFLCVVPKRTNKHVSTAAGDCGGPLLLDDKVVGVISYGKEVQAIEYITAVSPFITWIHNVIVPIITNVLNASQIPDK